jgi:hypothetical protein
MTKLTFRWSYTGRAVPVGARKPGILEAIVADLATAQRSISRHVGRFGANAAAGAEATFRITLGDTRS